MGLKVCFRLFTQGPGIGKACCIALAKAGANVVFGDLLKEKGEAFQQDWKKEKTAEDGDITFVFWDAKKAADCKELVKKTVDTYGRLDILFNNGILSTEFELILFSRNSAASCSNSQTGRRNVGQCHGRKLKELFFNVQGGNSSHDEKWRKYHK